MNLFQITAVFQSSDAGVLSPTQSWSLQFTWQHGSGEEEEEEQGIMILYFQAPPQRLGKEAAVFPLQDL